jgi:hypothetical protein
VFKSQNNFSLPLKQNRPNNNSNKNSNNEIPTEPALPPTPQPASQLPINPTHLPKVPTANTGNIFIHKGMEIGLIINLVKAKLPEYNIGFTQTEETLRDLFGIGTSQGNRASIT